MQNFVAIDKKMPEISAIKNLCSRKSGQNFAKNFRRILLNKTPNHAKFCGDRVKNARDIRNRKFVHTENVGQSSKILGDATPQKP